MSFVNQRANSKIKTPADFIALARELKKEGQVLVQCDGVFDLVHPGHIDYFWRAKSKGDILYVVLVGDHYVRKGPNRPIFDQNLRSMWIAALEMVDFVIINDDYGPRQIIEAVQPHFLVKGAEYQTHPTSGFVLDKNLVESYGGKVEFVLELAHSTDIIQKICRTFPSSEQP
ncbi:MAG: adenylyltransferase/cytidyltransferase family protein [Candidatus Liptonbacteria bacterium]|nr:adenylyltransferase/cytidyltransferase family protein [Candidatus Liptonbacteria bacterium]